ncbi:8097_t:CDS:2 [Entrophospora sp. SA101]|nr:8097_t:CDS:2 [Entrophospora sp. SA101]
MEERVNESINEEKTIKNSDTIPTPIIADDNDNSNDNDGLNELKDIDSEIYDNSHESHNQLEWNNGEMTIEQFREFWKKGYPFVIRNLKYEDQFWNPNYLSKRYGNTPCDTIDCKTDKIFHTTVREFFDGFEFEISGYGIINNYLSSIIGLLLGGDENNDNEDNKNSNNKSIDEILMVRSDDLTPVEEKYIQLNVYLNYDYDKIFENIKKFSLD